jgi:hypothetical protein
MDADRPVKGSSVPARLWPVGAAVLALYLAVALAMMTLGGHRVLPLFEGIGPPSRYEWVNPPPEFAAGNTKPGPATEEIRFTAGKTPATVVASSDSQFIVNLPEGAFAPHGADTAVRAVVTPLDPKTLGPVPAGLAADGNAYRIELTYQPSALPVTRLAVAGNVIINAPHTAEVILYSADGKSWSRLVTQSAGSPASVGARFTAPGWYVVGANPAFVTGAATPAAHGRSGTIFIAVAAAILAVIVAVVARVITVARRRAAADGGKQAGSRGPAPRPGRAANKPPHRRRPPGRKPR